MNDLCIQQQVGVEVVRKSSTDDRLEEPEVCTNCGNRRYWIVRCEHCGSHEQVKEEQ